MTTEKIDFTFLEDQWLCELLHDYWLQAQKAYDAEAYLGTIVACGAIVEGLLTWALQLPQNKAAAEKSKYACKDEDKVTKVKTVKPFEKWDITNLIKVSEEMSLIGNKALIASWAVKEFRNLIHPYNLLYLSARPNQGLALSAKGAVMEITRSLKGRLQRASKNED